MKAHKWDRGDPVPKTTRERMPWEIEMDKNRIPYDEDVLLWHWAERNRPVRCATHLTVYRNTSRTGVTVTDSGLESSTSFKDTFGAHSSRGDVNFVIGHTTPSRLQFNPPDCGLNDDRHGICPPAQFNVTGYYYGTVVAHLNESMWRDGCCIDVVPEDPTLRPHGHCRVQFVEYCSNPPPPPSHPPPSPLPSPPPFPPPRSPPEPPSPPPFPPPPSPLHPAPTPPPFSPTPTPPPPSPSPPSPPPFPPPNPTPPPPPQTPCVNSQCVPFETLGGAKAFCNSSSTTALGQCRVGEGSCDDVTTFARRRTQAVVPALAYCGGGMFAPGTGAADTANRLTCQECEAYGIAMGYSTTGTDDSGTSGMWRNPRTGDRLPCNTDGTSEFNYPEGPPYVGVLGICVVQMSVGAQVTFVDYQDPLEAGGANVLFCDISTQCVCRDEFVASGAVVGGTTTADPSPPPSASPSPPPSASPSPPPSASPSPPPSASPSPPPSADTPFYATICVDAPAEPPSTPLPRLPPTPSSPPTPPPPHPPPPPPGPSPPPLPSPPPSPPPMPPAHQCVRAFDVHVAIDSGNAVRVGGTNTLNTPVASDAVFYFHPDTSPFHVTNVLTTYSTVTASPGCTIDVAYDTKIPPRFGFHTGAAVVTPHADCGPGACLHFEYLDPAYNAAGVCRVRFSEQCM